MSMGRFFPLAVLATLGYHQSETIQDIVAIPVDTVKIGATHYELYSFRRMIVLHKLSDSLPRDFPNQFDGFLRRNFDSPYRDVALDYWGELYEAQREGEGFLLWSSGPDLENDTEDDIELLVPQTWN